MIDSRNVSVITAQNVHRDRINELGSQRFAADSGQKLVSFFSKDTWPGGAKSVSVKNQKTLKKTSPQAQLRNSEKDINPSLQRVLWDLPPDASDHRSGTLKLCKGLPLLIKYNEATECCVTNGAEAKVVDWISHKHPQSKREMLKILFVELQNPPTPIQLEGLPLNVVPISPDSKSINCALPDGSQLKINRSQIPVIPNFAMTDYCSQGRTRPFNVIHLNNCPTHQSYYTCLSRSATHEGTLILYGFNSGTIMGQLSGHLRQEFRELEVLDDISKLKYEALLPEQVNGIVRRDIITQYRRWKGDNHIPTNIHTALRWSQASPFILGHCDNMKWKIVQAKPKGSIKPLPLPIGHKKLTSYVPVPSTKNPTPIALQSLINLPSMNNVKEWEKGRSVVDFRTTKKPILTALLESTRTSIAKQMPLSPPSCPSQPTGTRWDSQNYSCAYDSLFTILWNMWKEDRHIIASQDADMQNTNFSSLIQGYSSHETGNITLEDARNTVRYKLHHQNSQSFPVGLVGVDMKDLLNKMFQYSPNAVLGQETTLCDSCGLHNTSSINIDSNVYTFSADAWRRSDMHNLPESPSLGDTEQCALLYFKSLRIPTPCSVCVRYLVVSKTFDLIPKLLVLHLGGQKMQISHKIVVQLNSRSYTFKLKGMIYFGSFHFTSQFVDNNDGVWYHDGVETDQGCQFQGQLHTLNNNALLYTHNRQLCTAIYSLI